MSTIRDENLSTLNYKTGDTIPPGRNVGDVKTIPQRTEIKVTEVKTDPGRHVFVLARPANDDAAEPFGWTSSMNLEGGFKNAEQSNIEISINSAFRTFQRQAELFHLFEIHQGNLAARPGASNHQHGQAFDLNTRHNVLDGTDKVYEWLKRNAPSHGFVRAVSKESWHWEYRPLEAAQLGPGKFMLPGIHD
jgi:hypothetical protein